MRIRAIDVRAARIDGLALPLRACTLAAVTEADGQRAWEASGWVGGSGPAPQLHEGVSDVVPVALETDEGTLAGSAVVSIAAAGGPQAAGDRLRLVGVGGLEPWPGF